MLVEREGRELGGAHLHGVELLECPGVGLRGAGCEVVFGEDLPGIGFGKERVGLRGGTHLAGYVAFGDLHLFDGKERFAGDPVEDVEVALLGGLGDGVDALAVVQHGCEHGRGGEVAVPDVVMDALEVPDLFAGLGVEREQGVGVEVVADAVAAVEVVDRRAGGREDHSAGRVDRESGPCVGGASRLPCACGPGLVAWLAGMWNGVEGPLHRAGS